MQATAFASGVEWANTMRRTTLERRIRYLLTFYLVTLVGVGFTTFPLTREVGLLNGIVHLRIWDAVPFADAAANWIAHVDAALQYNALHYPFLAYGTDWLAFAHIVIGLLFIGALRDPEKNI